MSEPRLSIEEIHRRASLGQAHSLERRLQKKFDKKIKFLDRVIFISGLVMFICICIYILSALH